MAVSISISITQNSQSIANNKSNVTVKVTASWTGGSHNAVVSGDGTPQANGWVKIDGTSYSFASTFNTGVTSSGSQVIFSKTLDVSHNSDGSKTLSCSASYSTYVSSGTVTASASKTLTTIPRKSSLSASNGTLGTAQTLTVTKQASSFTHTITYKCGSASGTVCTKSSSTSISWTPPLSLASQNTTGTSVSITFTITTYSGDTNVGSNTKAIICSIPASVKPSCSLTITDPTGYYDTYGGFVKGISKFNVVVTPTTSYGSSISSYKTTANGSTYTSSSFTTEVIKYSGNLTISATVTDERNRTGSASVTENVMDYSLPSIIKLTVLRANSDGTANDQGEYIKVTFSTLVTSLSNLNTAEYTLRYKRSNDSSWTEVPLTDYDNVYSVTDSTYTFQADTGSSYNVELTVSDNHNATTRSTTASTAFTLMHWNANGNSMSIGKVSELDYVLDIALQTFFRDHAQFANNTKLYGKKPDGTVTESLNPHNESGDTVLGLGNYNDKDGNTNIYGYDVNIGVSNITTPGTYRPYYRKGDSFTITLRTAGYITNSAKDLYFCIPLAKPVIGSPTISVSSVDGFILRQGNAYTHGSAESTYVKPRSYTASATHANGISIKATFSNVTKATNNDAIGIHWSGKVTFS